MVGKPPWRSFLTVCGEKLSADKYTRKFKDLIEEEGLHAEEIYKKDVDEY